MKNLLFLILVLPLLNACWNCNQITVENGHLPDSVLIYVPYQNGKTLQFKHSGGFIVNYRIERTTYDQMSGCSECCQFIYHYEENHTFLSPDYPLFDIHFYISNIDTIHIPCYASIGKYHFNIPVKNEYYEWYEQADSLKVAGKYYKSVFKLRSNANDYFFNDSIYVDSMYYNYENGILKILMSNREYYEIVE